MAVYGFARLVDDIGDGDLAPGGADARLLGAVARARPRTGSRMLDAFEADLRRVFDRATARATRCCARLQPDRAPPRASPPSPSSA